MSAAAELRLIDDLWAQMLFLLALVSGAFVAVDYLPFLLRPSAAPPSAAPAAATTHAPAAAGAPKHVGPWIVDAQGGSDASFTTIGAAVAAASDGDSIILRPGVYQERVTIAKSLVLSGAGAKPADVQWTFPGGPTLSITGGKVFLKGVSIAASGNSETAAVQLSGASLVLEQVAVASSGHAVLVRDGELDLSDGSLSGRRALSLEGKSRANLLRAEVHGQLSGVRVVGMGEARIESSRLRASRGQIVEAEQFAKVRMTEVSLTDSPFAAVSSRAGAEVKISRSSISDGQGCGVSLLGGSVSVERVRFSRLRCGVGFLGPGNLESIGSTYEQLQLGPLAITPGHEREVVVRGWGNTGLDIPEQKR